jgi:hypothetical protein
MHTAKFSLPVSPQRDVRDEHLGHLETLVSSPELLAMDAIKAEIERKRRLQQDAKETLGRKWVKRGEVEQIRQKQYYEEEARQAEERSKKAVAPQFRRAPDDGSASAAGVSSGADGAPTAGSSGGEHGGGASAATAPGGAKAAAGGKAADKENMKPTEVKRKLRLLGQPIQLFGEDDEERLEKQQFLDRLSALPCASVAMGPPSSVSPDEPPSQEVCEALWSVFKSESITATDLAQALERATGAEHGAIYSEFKKALAAAP